MWPPPPNDAAMSETSMWPRTEAEAIEVVFELCEEYADFDAVDAPRIVDETVGHGARAVAFSEHRSVGVECGEFAVFGDPERLEDIAEEAEFFGGIVFVDMGADIPDVDALGDEDTADAEAVGARRRIAE